MRHSRFLLLWLVGSAPLLGVLAALGLIQHGLFPGVPATPDLRDIFYYHYTAHPGVKSVFRFISDFGNPLLYPIYFTIWWIGRRSRDVRLTRLAICYLVIQLIVTFALVRVIKVAAGMPRPGVTGPALPFNFDAAYNAMPSGHTAEIVGAVLPLAGLADSLTAAFIFGLPAALVGFSRVYLGWHHPADVLVGWLVGSLSGWLIMYVWTRPRRPASRAT